MPIIVPMIIPIQTTEPVDTTAMLVMIGIMSVLTVGLFIWTWRS